MYVRRGVAVLAVILLAYDLISAQSFVVQPPQMPADINCFPDTAGYSVITVGPVGRDFTQLAPAIVAASLGTIIKVDPGLEYLDTTGNTVVELSNKKTGSGWIVIMSSRMDLLPKYGERVDPSGLTGDPSFPKQADAMPRIRTYKHGNGFRSYCFHTEPGGAHHYWLVGLDIGCDSDAVYSYPPVCLGYGNDACCEPLQDSAKKIPHHFGVDRCYIHGNETVELSMGIELNASHVTIIGNYVNEVHANTADGGYAIMGWNAPSQCLIANNFLQSSGINIFLGGSNNVMTNENLQLIPSDFVISNNLVSKSFKWCPFHPDFKVKFTTKNLFELKNAKRFLVEGNIFENNWPDSQDGHAIVLTVRSIAGSKHYSWFTLEDISFQNNIVRHVPSIFNFLGLDYFTTPDSCGQGQRWKINNNLCYDVDAAKYGNAGFGNAFQLQAGQEIEMDHNTIIHESGTVAAVFTQPFSKDIYYTNNISYMQDYGFGGSTLGGCCANGNMLIDTFLLGTTDSSKRFNRNLFVCDSSNYYNSAQFYPLSFSNFNTISKNYYTNLSSSVGYVDFSQGYTDYHNFSLLPSSAYFAKASNGKPVGVDMALLDSALERKWTACAGLPTSVIPAPVSEISFTLMPNPASVFAVANFRLERSMDVKLELFDAMGKCIMTIRKEYLAAGNFTQNIDLTGLATGLYFIKLNDVARKLMIL